MSQTAQQEQDTTTATQDMFYSYFLTRCSEFKIRKPSKWILSMLEDFNSLPNNNKKSTSSVSSAASAVLSAENVAIAADYGRDEKQQQVGEEDQKDKNTNTSNNNNNSDENIEIIPIEAAWFKESRPPLQVPSSFSCILPSTTTSTSSKNNEEKKFQNFSERTEIVIPPTIILGNTTLSILIEMMYFMPKLQIVDFSNCRVYDSDPQGMCPSGNDVLLSLFTWAAQHGAIASIDIGKQQQQQANSGNQIGTAIGTSILKAALQNPRLCEVFFDERGIEQHVLTDILRALRINKQTISPLSTAIRSIHVKMDPVLKSRMESMQELGSAIDRKSAGERQALLTVLYDRQNLFMPVLDSSVENNNNNNALSSTASASAGDLNNFVTPARMLRLSESHLSTLQGVRGDGEHLYIIAAGSVTIRLGRFDVEFHRGEIFGETISDEVTFYASGIITKRTEEGALFRVPHRVCQPLFSSWDQRVKRFLHVIKTCPILTSLPSYLQARCCFDAQLVSFKTPVFSSACSSTQKRKQFIREKYRVIKSGEQFSGFYVVIRGKFKVKQHKHAIAASSATARHLQRKKHEEEKQQQQQHHHSPTPEKNTNKTEKNQEQEQQHSQQQHSSSSSHIEFSQGNLFGEESLLNRRNQSTVNVDCVVSLHQTTSQQQQQKQKQQETTQNESEENNDANNDEPEYQLLQLDPTFCSTVLLPLLKTVLVLQTKTYSGVWAKEEDNNNLLLQQKKLLHEQQHDDKRSPSEMKAKQTPNPENIANDDDDGQGNKDENNSEEDDDEEEEEDEENVEEQKNSQ